MFTESKGIMENVEDVEIEPRKFDSIEEKPWGLSELIFYNSVCQFYRLEIKQGGKSTYGKFHKHRFRYNLLYVEYGTLKLFVNTFKGQREFILDPETKYTRYTVLPGVSHRFEAITEVTAYEVYYTYCNMNDIVRDE